MAPAAPGRSHAKIVLLAIARSERVRIKNTHVPRTVAANAHAKADGGRQTDPPPGVDLAEGLIDPIIRHLRAAVEQAAVDSNREILVVEHRRGDTEGMAELLSRASCTRIPYVGAFHYAAMNNLGATRATRDALVFLNDDVEPLTPHWLSKLLAHAWRHEVGVAGAKPLYPPGAIQHAGIAIGITSTMHEAGRLGAADGSD